MLQRKICSFFIYIECNTLLRLMMLKGPNGIFMFFIILFYKINLFKYIFIFKINFKNLLQK